MINLLVFTEPPSSSDLSKKTNAMASATPIITMLINVIKQHKVLQHENKADVVLLRL